MNREFKLFSTNYLLSNAKQMLKPIAAQRHPTQVIIKALYIIILYNFIILYKIIIKAPFDHLEQPH